MKSLRTQKLDITNKKVLIVFIQKDTSFHVRINHLITVEINEPLVFFLLSFLKQSPEAVSNYSKCSQSVKRNS